MITAPPQVVVLAMLEKPKGGTFALHIFSSQVCAQHQGHGGTCLALMIVHECLSWD